MSHSRTYQRPTKVFNPCFIALLGANFAAYFNLQMLQTNIITYINTMTSTQFVVSLVPVIYSLVALAMRPFSGAWIDRFDKKKLLLISQLGLTASALLYPLAGNAFLVIAIRSINGIFFGLNTTAVMAVSSDFLPEEKMGSGLGIFGLSTTLAMAMGPSLGDILVRNVGYNIMFLVSAAATLIAAVCTLFIYPRPTEVREKKRIMLSDFFAKEALMPSLIILFDSVATSTINNYLLLYGQESGIVNIGLFFTIYSIVLVATRPIAGKLADKFDPKYIIYPTQIMIAATMLFLGMANGMGFIILAAIAFGAGYGAVSPVLQAMALQSVPESRRGAASGTYYLAMDVANILIPLVCAGLYGVFSNYGASFRLLSFAPLFGIVILFVYNKKKQAK